MLELHVWGPGLNLPSIDPPCLAAIAYCNLVLSPSEWRVIPSSNPLLSPSKSLPALRSAPGIWHAGLPAIIAHLSTLHSSLDSHLSPADTATVTALTSYLHLHAQPLIDLLLYANPRNFSTTTRPLFSALLPFPRRYYVPIQLKNAALERTGHLGFVFPAPSPVHKDPIDAAEQARGEERRGVPKTQALEKMKLSRMVDELLGHVDRRLQQGVLGEEEATSADCVALGYLAVLNVEVPEPFGREGLQRWPRVKGYLERMGERAWGKVPLGEPESGDLAWLGAEMVQAGKKWLGFEERVDAAEEGKEAEEIDEQMKKEMVRQRKEWWKSVAWVAAGVVGWVGYLVLSGAVVVATGEEEEEVVVEEEVVAGGNNVLAPSMDVLGNLGAALGKGWEQLEQEERREQEVGREEEGEEGEEREGEGEGEMEDLVGDVDEGDDVEEEI